MERETLKGVLFDELYDAGSDTQGYLTGGDPEIQAPTAAAERTTDYIPVSAGDMVSLTCSFDTPRDSWAAYILYDTSKKPRRRPEKLLRERQSGTSAMCRSHKTAMSVFRSGLMQRQPFRSKG